MKITRYALRVAATAVLAWPLVSGTACAQGNDAAGDGASAGSQQGSSQKGNAQRSSQGERGQSNRGSSSQRSSERSSAERSGNSDRSARSEQQRSQRGEQAREQSNRQGEQARDQGDRRQGDQERSQENRRQGERNEQRRSEGENARQGERQSFYRGDYQAPDDRQQNRTGDRDERTWQEAIFGEQDDQQDRQRDQARNRGQRGDGWDQFTREVRREWSGQNRNDLPFRTSWWDGRRNNDWPVISPWRYSRWQNRGQYFWYGYAPANRLTGWLAFNWGRPYYWDYGPGRNIYYQNDYVYYDGRQALPAQDYYQEVYDLAHNVPSYSESEAQDMEWQPLGVFAVTRENESQSQRALQLAVNREGVLTGTYFNRANDHVHPVTGQVDDQSQRAAWAFADGEHKALVFETSIYNLTQPEASMMVHFGPRASDTQVWQLVRLEQPSDSQSATSAPPRTLP